MYLKGGSVLICKTEEEFSWLRQLNTEPGAVATGYRHSMNSLECV